MCAAMLLGYAATSNDCSGLVCSVAFKWTTVHVPTLVLKPSHHGCSLCLLASFIGWECLRHWVGGILLGFGKINFYVSVDVIEPRAEVTMRGRDTGMGITC